MGTSTRDGPNIVLIMADQMTPFLTGVYGHPVVRTPHLERLAAEGIRFDAAYSSCPLCVPARASLMTGKHISRIGVWDNASPLATDEPTIAHYLSAAGYDTVASGKLHYVGPDQLHGLRKRLTTDPHRCRYDMLRERRILADDGEYALDRGTRARHYALPHVGVRDWNRWFAYDEEVQAQALQYLHARTMGEGNDPAGPFFLCVSYFYPHDPFEVTRDLWDLYEGAPIELPEYPPDMEESYSVMDRWLNAHHGTDRIDIRQPESLVALRRCYYGLVTYIDRKVGELLDALRRTGLDANTVVVFTSDHGDMMAEKGMVQKRSLYEWSSRIPLIVRFPDGRRGGTCRADPVSLMDIAPTILDLAGVQDRLPMDGQSLLPTIEGSADPGRIVFSEMHVEGVYAPCFMARHGAHKLVLTIGHDAQLFDLGADPGEWHNLAGSAAVAAVEHHLREGLSATFDAKEIEARIQDSLRRRRLVRRAVDANDTRYRYVPPFDAARLYD